MESHKSSEVVSSTLDDARRLVRATTLAGNCSHPIRLWGESVNLATGEVAPSRLAIRCKDRRALVCTACSDLYKADAWILVSAGLSGGKGVREDVAKEPRLFVTLTAPSFGPVHRRTASGNCHLFATGPCLHGAQLRCRRKHEENSVDLGTPLCTACFDYEAAVSWNAFSSKLWNRTIQELRRQLVQLSRATSGPAPVALTLSYLKVAEFQRRGLVHFHVVLRVDGATKLIDDDADAFDNAAFIRVVHRAIQTIQWTAPSGLVMRWGTQFDVRDLAFGEGEPTKVASYIAKYATKTTNDSVALARRFNSRVEITNSKITAHLAAMATVAWDLAATAQFAEWNLRAHAHTLGFTGQIITKSRHFSTTFRELREVRARYMAPNNTSDPIQGTYSYAGRGYDDPRAAQLAALFHSMMLDLRREASARRRAEAAGTNEVSA